MVSAPPPPPPPPPPPDDPFTTPGNNGDYDNGGGLDTGAPAVAASKSKTMVIMGGIGLVALYMLYSIFSGGSEEEAPVEQEPQPVVQQEYAPPELPVDTEPAFVPPPVIEPPPAAPTVLSPINPEEDSGLKAQIQARQRSNMMVVENGGGAFGLGEGDDDEQADSADPNSQFAAATINNSKASKSIATRIGDLRRIIAQGRMIHATLETVINTDLPAPIRAIVSRDIYGEAGTIPLIPAGSRLIGKYNTNISGGQTRVFVVWLRVIRPDGIDVQLGSPLVDQIGQAGIGGQVDTKFQYIFSRAVMASVVSIAFAIGSDEISPGESESSTTNSTFGTTQSGDAASTATVNALNRLGSLTETFLQKFLDIGPTILVDQGTPVNVFVNRDLIFPAELVGSQFIN